MLPWSFRLFFWGIHGVFVEVVFTSGWEFAVTGDPTLKGFSSVWSFFIYGIGMLLAERPYFFLTTRGIPLPARVVAYVLLAYAWEFIFGLLLRQFGFCPWDYSDFDYNLMGLITFEYLPVWAISSIYCEFLMSVLISFEEAPRWKALHKAKH